MPRMQLLSWTPNAKADALLKGRAKVLLPIGLEIDGVGLFERPDGARWAQLPSEIVRDADGQPLKDDRGKFRYRSLIRWSSRALQEGFSAALFELVEASTGAVPKARPAPSPTRPALRPRRSPLTGDPLPDDDVTDLWREEMVP